MHRDVHLYFTREKDIPELHASDEVMDQVGSMSRRVIMCTSWAELPEKLKLKPRSICFNYRELEHSSASEIVSMVRTMSKLVNLPYEIKIAVDIGPDTPRETVKLLQKSEIQGIIPRPADFGWEECLKASEAVWAGIPYWPKHILDQLPDTPRLPNLVYYKDDHTESVVCTREIVNSFGCTFVNINTWQELVKEIESGEDKIVLHLDTITKSSGTIKEYIKSIKDIVKFIPNANPLKILVVITPTTTQQQVAELKASGCTGIGLDMKYYSVEQAISGAQAVLNGTPYWPQSIIDSLPSIKKKPVHIYFRETKDEDANVTPELVEDYNQYLPVRAVMCANWSEFEQLIADTSPYQVVLHASRMSTQNATIPEMISMIETRLKLHNLHDVPIAMVVDRDTPLKEVKSWKRLGVFGIIPFIDDKDTHTETIRGVEALTNRIPYWPKHILDQLPGAVKKEKKDRAALTDRQQEVFQLIVERGASNKVIAKMLNLSESTVKLHLGHIFKKYGVKNRTQLAVFARK